MDYPSLDNAAKQPEYVYTPQPHYEQQQPASQYQQQVPPPVYTAAPSAPKRNPLIVASQATCGCCACFVFFVGLVFAVSYLSVGLSMGSFTFDTAEYESNVYQVPFQQFYSVNGVIGYDGTFNLTLEAAYMVEDLSKMRMCLKSPVGSSSTFEGVAQAIVPYSEYAYEGAYFVEMCEGPSAVLSDGVGLCSTGDIYSTINGNPGDSFTLEVYYDYCHTDWEICSCDYVAVYIIYILIFLFSIGFAFTCMCCSCCCCSSCLIACGVITCVDSANRSRAEAYPIVATL